MYFPVRTPPARAFDKKKDGEECQEQGEDDSRLHWQQHRQQQQQPQKVQTLHCMP